jgi:hypothetical protein
MKPLVSPHIFNSSISGKIDPLYQYLYPTVVGLISEKLYSVMMSCDSLRSYLSKLPGNNKDYILGQFKNIDGRDGLLSFLPEVTKHAFKEQINEKREYYEKSCLVHDSDETVTVHADALCFRTKQKSERYRPRIQVIKSQTIIEATTLKLRMWVYSDEVSAKHPGMCYKVIITFVRYINLVYTTA